MDTVKTIDVQAEELTVFDEEQAATVIDALEEKTEENAKIALEWANRVACENISLSLLLSGHAKAAIKDGEVVIYADKS